MKNFKPQADFVGRYSLAPVLAVAFLPCFSQSGSLLLLLP
jgi:hypothetical protein